MICASCYDQTCPFAFFNQSAGYKQDTRMGEEAWRVHTVGFPAIDMISEGNYATEEEIVDRLGLDLSKPIVLFTQHSVTTEFDRAGASGAFVKGAAAFGV